MTKRPSTRAIVRLGVIAALLVTSVSGTFAYLGSARYDGDVRLADNAVEGLTFVGNSALPMGAGTDFSNALEDNWSAIDLFLHSDSRTSLAELATAIERSWLSYLVADQLWRMSDEGDTRPLVSQVYASDELLASAPALRVVVVGSGSAARFDNSGQKAVKAIFGQARRDRAEAARLLAAAYARPR